VSIDLEAAFDRTMAGLAAQLADEDS